MLLCKFIYNFSVIFYCLSKEIIYIYFLLCFIILILLYHYIDPSIFSIDNSEFFLIYYVTRSFIQEVLNFVYNIQIKMQMKLILKEKYVIYYMYIY